MANCVECFHKEICLHRANILNDTYSYLGIKYDTENCKYYTPTADVVEVVRCKDCRFWIDKACTTVNGAGPDKYIPNGDWFCCSGLRKE